MGSKMGIDATAKIEAETHREWGRKIRMSDDIIEEVTKKWKRYGLPGSGNSIWKK
jgi:4-hydroxy-3-polyprenylbenzoate decarboxylase